MQKNFPNHVICGYDKINKIENPQSFNLPKVVVNSDKRINLYFKIILKKK